MKATIDKLATRFQDLIGDVNFWSDFDKVIDSQEYLMAMGSHNIKEFAKIEAMDEECQERIRNIVSNILASVLQIEAMEQYGNAVGVV